MEEDQQQEQAPENLDQLLQECRECFRRGRTTVHVHEPERLRGLVQQLEPLGMKAAKQWVTICLMSEIISALDNPAKKINFHGQLMHVRKTDKPLPGDSLGEQIMADTRAQKNTLGLPDNPDIT